MSSILYVNTHAARYGWYFGRKMPQGYRLAASFWGSGLIDRTKTLYTGFPYEILYPMPRYDPTNPPPDIPALCDASGKRIVQEAIGANREIQILWSGGIDSTAAAVGIIKAATEADRPNIFEILLTDDSIREYPDFYRRFVKSQRHRFVSPPVTSHIDPRHLIVTGEHGDQIFGSAKAAKYVADSRAFEDYEQVLPLILQEELASAAKADVVMRYMEPLFDASPIRLRTLFDALWWINFSLKWQIVGLRLAVFRVRNVRQTFNSLRHYYSDLAFQRWSLVNHGRKIERTWESYKMPLKDYIYQFTGDDEYRRNKTKVPSLKAVFIADAASRPPAYRVLMDEGFAPVFWQFTRFNQTEYALRLPRRNRGA